MKSMLAKIRNLMRSPWTGREKMDPTGRGKMMRSTVVGFTKDEAPIAQDPAFEP